MTHFDGDVPPTMSPLDAFAAQSRLLARQLDDSQRDGRRVSRLPPMTIADSLAKPRPGYFRSRSPGQKELSPPKEAKRTEEEPTGLRMAVEDPTFRPKSYYPRVSAVPGFPNGPGPVHTPSGDDQPFLTPFEHPPTSTQSYFGVPRSQSPEAAAHVHRSPEQNDQDNLARSQSANSSYPTPEPERGMSGESSSSLQNQHPNSLIPPSVRQAASIRSVPMDSSDDEHTTYTTGSSISQNRKLSSSSGVSVPYSPLSQSARPHVRSPSANSEYSLGGTRLRPAMNFSRPISRNSRPSVDLNSRQPSIEGRPSISYDESVQTPSSLENEEFFESKEQQIPAPSYIYAKFSLPRGRMLQRDSLPLESSLMPFFEWQLPTVNSNVMPATPPVDEYSPFLDNSPSPSVGSKKSPRNSTERLSVDKNQQPATRPPPVPVSDTTERQSLFSQNSGSTIKARSSRVGRRSTEITAEEHLEKGIECHESGSLKESTYHLRIAARQNLPTAMLLYALACRHGWGMRPNQQEGVEWLRKAADCASIELKDDQIPLNQTNVDVAEKKTRRAQFALSVYELGVSHMNGWGIEQDKALALKCFEIAANWGDADAMAEAGFCFAQAVGCKKDLKKAAKYYRMAETKGVSMVGNSW